MIKDIVNNHKKLGEKLKLFFFHRNTGLPIWLPNGIYLYNKIKFFLRKINLNNKYLEVSTPYIGNYSIYKKSGHINKYKNNIFEIKYKKKIYLKPMSCPYHCIIYKNFNNISYKKLPIKLFEFGTVFRNEKHGELNGLFRSQVFTQDDGHIFCKNNKEVINEINNIINIIKYIYKKFYIKKFYIRLSLKSLENNNKYIGLKKNWEKSEKILKYIIKINNVKYKIIYGDAAFYGPKIDFIIKDSINREWQLSTIQIDYNTPKKFNLKYINKYNKIYTPIMIHRAYLGSIERFIGILIESTSGNLPFWLLKVQIVIIPVYNSNHIYILKIYKKLKKNKIRCYIDNSKNNINIKIKKYEKLNIPIIILVGNKEIANNKIFIRQKNKRLNISLKEGYKYILNYIYNNK
ncbi:MAG: threonine--tRNA ligase [Candidatus Shikimatogenerans bostrichidophilus]|nr:MAG: threonine--tRNA ligase [Candidatus Shikimatogenerans bostrichidophilus]